MLQLIQAQLKHLAQARALSSHELANSLRQINLARREVMSPAESLIDTLHSWVAFGIMPIFALANAGVSLGGLSFDPGSTSVALGATVGLVLGKPLGILLVCWLTLRLGIAALPAGLNRRHLIVLGVVAGIGFTMAIFIAQLAFTDPNLLAAAKLGVLGASAIAAIAGLLLGRLLLKPVARVDIAQTADEAEASTAL
jgi:NhaA family Na+:H+ antiporter